MARFAPSRRLATFLLLVVAVLVVAWLWASRRTRWDDSLHPPPPAVQALAEFAEDRIDAGIALLRACAKRYDAPSWEARLALAAAFRLDAAGRRTEVLEFLSSPPDPSSLTATYGDVLRARALMASGEASEALVAARRARSAEGFPQQEEAIRLEASALEALGRKAEALKLVDSSGSPSLLLEGASIAERAGNIAAATDRLAGLVLTQLPGDVLDRALDRLSKLQPEPALRWRGADRSQVLETARRWLLQGRAAQALDLLRASRAAWPPQPALASARHEETLAEADALIRLGRAREARALLSGLPTDVGETGDGALYLDGKARVALGSSSTFAPFASKVAARPGRSVWKCRALLDLARASEGRPSIEALKRYRAYRLTAGREADAIALWRETWLALELRRHGDAAEGFARVLANPASPGSTRAAALYWSARRLEELGRAEAARARYREILTEWRSHYYGLLARRRLGLPLPIAASDRRTSATRPNDGPAGRWLGAARDLRSVGLDDLSWECYRAAAAAAAPEAHDIALEGADAALEAGSPSEALRFVHLATGGRDAADPERLPLRFWKLLVPAPPDPALVRLARASGLDPVLVASVALEESAFNPFAVSPVGARGLLQLMPTTGADLARELGVQGFRPERLFEPELNLRLGTHYLKKLLDRFGSVPLALVAFNAGPSRAERWSLPQDRPGFEAFVERIPYADTRSYVKRIIANLSLYRIAWPEGFAASPS